MGFFDWLLGSSEATHPRFSAFREMVESTFVSLASIENDTAGANSVAEALRRGGTTGQDHVVIADSPSVTARHLAAVPRLVHLDLKNLPGVTTAGLRELLRSRPELLSLSVFHLPAVGPAEIRELRKEFPRVAIASESHVERLTVDIPFWAGIPRPLFARYEHLKDLVISYRGPSILKIYIGDYPVERLDLTIFPRLKTLIFLRLNLDGLDELKTPSTLTHLGTGHCSPVPRKLVETLARAGVKVSEKEVVTDWPGH